MTQMHPKTNRLKRELGGPVGESSKSVVRIVAPNATIESAAHAGFCTGGISDRILWLHSQPIP